MIDVKITISGILMCCDESLCDLALPKKVRQHGGTL